MRSVVTNRTDRAVSANRGGLGTALVAGLLVTVPAQLAFGEALQEILITAQKREQSLQSVGVSVSALTADDLREAGVTGPLNLGQAVPGLQMNSASGGGYGGQLTIRGISQSDYSPHQESPNSMYIDDIYISAPNEQVAQMFDIQRVEVLRGPQGTLFGRNSTGGLVNFITAKPTKEFEGYVNLDGGSFSLFRGEGAVSGSLTDKIQGRLSAAIQSNDGYNKNHIVPEQRDLNDTHFYGVRGQLAAEITDTLTVLASITYRDDDTREGFYSHLVTFPDPANGNRPGPLPPNVDFWGTGPGNDLQGYRDPYAQTTEGEVDFVGFLKRSITSPTLRFDWKLGSSATLTSLTNFTTMRFRYDENCDGAPQFTCRDPFRQDLDQWSQELRVNGTYDKLTWVGGFYALSIHSLGTGAFSSPFYADGPFAFDSFNNINQRLFTYAIFGQGEYLFTDHWRATLGLRVTRDEKSFSSQAYLNQLGNFVDSFDTFNPPELIYDFSPATVGSAAIQKKTDWSGKIQIDYIINDKSLLYVSVSRGIKGPGFNANAGGGTTIEQTPFKGESVYVYEFGEKLTLLNDRLRVNGAGYYYDYTNFQAYQLALTGVTPVVTNNDAKFVGGELEITARPIDGLDFRGGMTYLDSAVYKVATAQIGVVTQQASDAPRWVANWSVRYAFPIAKGTLALQYTGDYIADKFHSVDNIPAVLVNGSVGHNARASYSWDKWELAAFVNNFTNENRQSAAYDLTASYGYAVQTYQPPRWWGGSLRYSF
jgi:iron complex outermembrane receptor protein